MYEYWFDVRFIVAWNLHVLLDDNVYWFELGRWMEKIESQLKLMKEIAEGRRWKMKGMKI